MFSLGFTIVASPVHVCLGLCLWVEDLDTSPGGP